MDTHTVVPSCFDITTEFLVGRIFGLLLCGLDRPTQRATTVRLGHSSHLIALINVSLASPFSCSSLPLMLSELHMLVFRHVPHTKVIRAQNQAFTSTSCFPCSITASQPLSLRNRCVVA